MSELSAEELGHYVFNDRTGPLVLDIRHPDEYEEWHIPGSRNIDVYDELANDPGAAKRLLSGLPTDREIVTVCTAGIMSQEATELLTEMGYEATTLTDGMNGWSHVHLAAPIDLPIDGTLVQVARPGKGCLSYVLISDGEAAVFDPSLHVDEYIALIDEHDVELIGVFDSHAHADHVSGGRKLADAYDVPYYLHPADAIDIESTPVHDGEHFDIGNVELVAIHTPGHSPGGVSYAVQEEALLTGDTLFHESVGRVELGVEAGIEETDVSANAATLYESLQKLHTRDSDPLVLPAHDPGAPNPPVVSRLSEVTARNDDLSREREPFIDDLASDIPEHPPNFQRVKGINVGLETIEGEELADLELGPNRCAAE